MTRRQTVAKATRRRTAAESGSRRKSGQLSPSPAMAVAHAYPVPRNGLGFGVAPNARQVRGLILHLQTGYCVDPQRGDVYGRSGEPIGSPSKDGYVRLRGVEGISTTLYAHRVVWEVVNGPIPPGFHIDHKNARRADNRTRNLQAVTPSRNAALCFERGGRQPGEGVATAKLTARQVRRIRAQSHIRNADFARLYGLDPSTIRAVRTGKTWRHLLARNRRPRRGKR